MGDSSKLRRMKNDILPLCLWYAPILDAACSIFLNAETIFFF